MSHVAGQSRDWARIPSAFALAATALGALLSLFWAVVGGLWTFAVKDYGALATILAIAALLVATPVVAVGAAMKGKPRVALALTLPALLLYGAAAVVAVWG